MYTISECNVLNPTLDNIRFKKIKNIECRLICLNERIVLLEKERLRLMNGT